MSNSTVQDQTAKPSPTSFPPLVSTLHTNVGMVLYNGQPFQRPHHTRCLIDQHDSELVETRTTLIDKTISPVLGKNVVQSRVKHNFKACAIPVSKDELLEYISSGKRLDMEQTVAMTISYLTSVAPTVTDAEDDFEDSNTPLINQLLTDPGTVKMMKSAHMWRTAGDYLTPNKSNKPREARKERRKRLALLLVGCPVAASAALPSDDFIVSVLQKVRRKRNKLANKQHLTFPSVMLPEGQDESVWGLSNRYSGQRLDDSVNTADANVIAKRHFRRVQRALSSLSAPSDLTSAYCLEVYEFIESQGSLAPARIAALQKSVDPFAIAYSFVTAQRHRQLKVVSDQSWTRFLVKGEGSMILQNRPGVLTSFEDILVRHATDLVALTAVNCPPGLRDKFSSIGDVLARTRRTCELMERYVALFGDGKMDNLVFDPKKAGGSGRGPVDVYNALVDELRDCSVRAKQLGEDLGISACFKFLAKDIMAWNHAWQDDAFANGKLPGWVEYLARVRAEEFSLS